MLTAEFRLVEFLDNLPMSGCGVSLTILVAPVYEEQRIEETPEGGPPRPPGPPPRITVEVPDFSLAQRTTLQVSSGSDGRAPFSFDAGAFFATALRTKRHNDLPVAALAVFDVAVDCFGLTLLSRRAIAETTDQNSSIERVVIVDVAKSIVGHTTATTTMLWFQLHGPPKSDHRYFCDVRPASGPVVSLPAAFATDRANTAVVTVSDLQAGGAYRYSLRLVRPSDPTGRVLTQGRFQTMPATVERLSLAFASCHQPTSEAALNRWQVLARRDDYDLLLLIGDQIYGDGIEKIFPHDSWFDRYVKRYNQLWAYQPMRNALRKTPVYMTLDDHEIVDDWGTLPVPADRLAAGLQAYRIFQQAHNPGGFSSPTIDYHFRYGPAAFFSMDSRTARGLEPNFPVLGQAQFNRLRQWAYSTEARSADVIFFVAPVPLAMLPLQDLQILADRLSEVAGSVGGSLIGALVGAIVAGVITGGLGAGGGAVVGSFIGGMVGALGAEIAYEHVEDTIDEPDVRDAWTFGLNVMDMTRVLDVLFDLANDIQPNGQPGPRPRAVIILAGDYHFGALHRLDSKRTGGGHDHRTNPRILQVTSSPISHSPVRSDIFEDIIQHVEGKPFDLDSSNYRAEYLSRTMVRNFGRVTMEHVGPGRKYRFQLFDEGEDGGAIMQLVEYDLDARPVTMRDLMGELLAARGKVTLLRINDVGGGYGPASDFIDAEVIVQLDSQPGRAFGFQLRKDANLAMRRRMLGLLRDAFERNRTVHLEYLRTGIQNGKVIRVTEI